MPVILSAFDMKMGPVAVMVIPNDFDKRIVQSVINTFDITVEENELIVKDFSTMGIKSYNLQFKLNSPWARGLFEQMQISVVTTEANPPEALIKEKMFSFKEKMNKSPEIYAGLYYKLNDNDQTRKINNSELIDEEYKKIRDVLIDLESESLIGMQRTSAILVNVPEFLSKGVLQVPQSFINEVKKKSFLAGDDGKLFTVFRNDGTGTTIINVTMTKKKIFLLKVDVESLDPMIIMHLRRAVPKECIYTNGFCQKRCSYEAYFTFDGDFDEVKRDVESRVRQIGSIKKIELTLVESTEKVEIARS